MSLEKKTLVLSKAKASDDDNGYLEGYGAVKGNVDSYGDRIVDGAFLNLDEFTNSGFMADHHDWAKDIGFIVEAREDAHGLWVKMAFYPTTEAQEIRKKVASRLAAGKAVGLSIGYFTKVWEWAEEDGKDIRILKGIDIAEVSVVTMPANPKAQVTSAKDKTVSADPSAKGFGEEFDGLAQSVEDFIGRAAKVADERGEKWKAERGEQYRRMAEKLTAEADAMEAKTDANEIEPPKAANADLVRRAMELAQTSN